MENITLEDAKKLLQNSIETKAGTLNTQQSGLPVIDQFAKLVFEEARNESPFLKSLPGYHPTLTSNLVVPIIGGLDYFEKAPEYLDTDEYTGNKLNYNYQRPVGRSIKLTRTKMILTVPVSYEMIDSGYDIVNYIYSELRHSVKRTAESTLLNADPTTGTNNINAKGKNVESTSLVHWLAQNGARKSAFAHSTTVDVGALDQADLFSIKGKLGRKAARSSDLLIVTNAETANKIQQLPVLMNAYQNGRNSTFVTGMDSQILGSDIYISEELALTDETGSVDANTKENNTKGTIIFLNKNAPQFGMSDLRIEPQVIPGYGIHYVATYYFAHGYVTSDKNPSVAMGINVTV